MLILWIYIFTCSYGEYTYKWHAHASECRDMWRPEVICSCRRNKKGKQLQFQIMMNAMEALKVKRQSQPYRIEATLESQRASTEKVTLGWDLVGAQHRRTGRAYKERKTNVMLLDQWWAGPSDSTLEHGRGNLKPRPIKTGARLLSKRLQMIFLFFNFRGVQTKIKMDIQLNAILLEIKTSLDIYSGLILYQCVMGRLIDWFRSHTDAPCWTYLFIVVMSELLLYQLIKWFIWGRSEWV